MTIPEMAEKLNVSANTIRVRLQRAGIKPFCQSALYTDADFERIKSAPMGRPPKKTVLAKVVPKKAAEPETAKPKTKKPAKGN